MLWNREIAKQSETTIYKVYFILIPHRLLQCETKAKFDTEQRQQAAKADIQCLT